MLTLNNLQSPGATKKRKRIGRGQGSGWGTQAGKGHKGQKARKSGGVRVGFEGGQTPLYRRLPKKGFTNVFASNVLIVRIDRMNVFASGEEVNSDSLLSKGLVSRSKLSCADSIKFLGQGEVPQGLKFKGNFKFSAGAEAIIKKSGGVIS